MNDAISEKHFEEQRPIAGPIGRARLDTQEMDRQQLHEISVAVIRGGFTPRREVTIPQEAYFERFEQEILGGLVPKSRQPDL